MTFDRTRDEGDPVPSLPRRGILASVAAAVGSLAGCGGGVTSYEFEATPVQLPAEARDELVLAESVVDANTITRTPSVADIEGEVTITSHIATYRRGPARGYPTLMEKFLCQVNGMGDTRAAVVVTGSDLGVGEITLPMFEEDMEIPPDLWSLVVPAGARTDDEIAPEETMLLVPGTAFPDATGVPRADWRSGSDWIQGPDWFPSAGWIPDGDWNPGTAWLPDADPATLPEQDDEILLATRERSPEDLFGLSADELPGRPLEDGDAFDPENSLLAVPGSEVIRTSDPISPETVFDAGVPAPLGGATFGLGVLATPAAKVAGQSLNPVSDMGFGELLTSDQARGILGDTEFSDGVRWRRGPERFEPEWNGVKPVDLLDTRTEINSYRGAIEGDNGPWGAVVNLARITDEDVVITAGTQVRPLGTAQIPDTDWLGSGWELSSTTFESVDRL